MATGSDPNIKINITADAGDSIEAFRSLKTSVSQTEQEFTKAQENVKGLARNLRENDAETESLRYQLTLAKSALDQLAESGKRSGAEYRDLKGQVKALDAGFRQSSAASQSLRSEFTRAISVAGNYKSILQGQSQQLELSRRAMAAAGINIRALASEHVRLKQEASAVAQSLRSTATSAQSAGQAAAAAGKNFAETGTAAASAFSKAKQGVESISTHLERTKAELIAFFGAQKIGEWAADVGRVADAWNGMNARLKLATRSQEEFSAAQDAVFAISQKTQSDLGSIGNLYGKLATAVRGLGGSQAETAQLTETIAQSFRISGATAQETSGAIIQLSQALASGALRGDEFNSVIEQAPRLQQALAEGLGVPIGKLRELAEAGRLTSAEIIRALESQSSVISREFQTLPQTIGGSVQKLENQWMQFIGHLDEGSEASKKAASAIGLVADHLGDIVELAKAAGEATIAALVVRATPAVVGFGRELFAAAGQAGGLTTAIGKIPTSIKIGIAVAGLELLPEAGRFLGESMAKLSGAGEEASESLKKVREQASHNILAAEELALRNKRYSDTVTLTAAEVQHLSDKERESYRARLDGANQYQIAQLRIALNQNILGQNTQVAAEKAGRALAELRDGLAAVERAAGLSREELANLLSVDAANLLAEFDGLIVKGKEVKDALSGLDHAIDPGAPGSIRAWGQALIELKNTGKISMEEMRAAFADFIGKLKPDQLTVFSTAMHAAFGEGKRDLEAMGVAADSIVSESLKRLGVDASQVLTGLSSEIKQSLGDFDALRDGLDATGRTGKEAGDLLVAALSGIASKAKTTQDLESIRAKLGDLSRSGQADFNKLVQAYLDVDHALAKIKPTTDQVAAAQTQARASADAAAVAARALQAGTLSVAEAQKSFAKAAADSAAVQDLQARSATGAADSMANFRAQLAAAGEAAKGAADGIRGLSDAGTKAEQAFAALESRMGSAGEAGEHLSDSSNQAISIYGQVTEALERYSRGASEALFAELRLSKTFQDDWKILARFAQYAQQQADQMERNAGAVGRLNDALSSGTGVAGAMDDAMSELSRSAARTADGFQLLDDQTLSNLRSAIESARQQMEQLKDSAVSTVQSLQDELFQLQGNVRASEELRYKQKVDELNRRLEESQQAGNAEAVAQYQQALALENQIHAKKLSNIEAEAKARKKAEEEDARRRKEAADAEARRLRDESEARSRAQEEESRKARTEPARENPGVQPATEPGRNAQDQPRTQSPPPSGQAALAPASTGREMTVNLHGPSGSVRGRFAEEDAARFIDLLKSAGMRTN